ncbi:MAG: ATP-binding cassette domain-containing protein [Streptosporangiales bacterium]|nr:ATP-binding cassette domain-containing protein [Streptosporangiales bacterium]
MPDRNRVMSLIPALDLRGLTKRYGDQLAVDDLSLTVPAGSFYEMVGPNGAGKTTTLSMATGLLRPDAGSATVSCTAMRPGPTSPPAAPPQITPETDVPCLQLESTDRRCGAE